MHKPLMLLVLFFACSSHLHAQKVYLGDDLAFFQKKAQLYQEWLDAKGMGQMLKVDKVRLQKNNMELELFLNLRTTDPDTAAGMWQSLDQAFLVRNPGGNLREVLFHTFERMMEIPAAQGNVQIYIPNKNGFGYNTCFYVWIWEENGRITLDERINACRAQSLEIVVKKPVVKTVGLNTPTKVQSGENAHQVFNKILEYARRHYEETKCEDRFPQVEEVEISDYQLTFSVNDLCREVLKDEKASLWCRLVRRWMPCNDMRRERLEFTFFYIATQEGYVLKGHLTGKFGSGIYQPRKSAYMDMEPDFEDDFLIPYVKDFQNSLRTYLEKR